MLKSLQSLVRIPRAVIELLSVESRTVVRACSFLLLVSLMLGGLSSPLQAAIDFESQVKPVLEERCFKCHSHSAKKLKGGLFLDSLSGILQGGDSGASIVPGEPGKSRLIEAILYENTDLQMPPKSKLDEEEIAILEKWVKDGAVWTGSEATVSGKTKKGFDLQQRRADHWAWQPVERVEPPMVNDERWPTSKVDNFILAQLESAGIGPAPKADRRTLIRRLYLTLIGLPPTPEQVSAFENDNSAKAYDKLVDQLLALPQFGERWARHWMDVVRYAETLGHEFDYVMPNAWRYRDYLIRAINEDVPYDQFIREHLAGDLMENPRIDPKTGLNESAAATAFFWFGQQVHSPVDIKAYQLEVIDNQIDTLTRGFQALTVSCARCHDHKFDAISTKDFYALYGVMESSRYAQVDLRSEEKQANELHELTRLREELEFKNNGSRRREEALEKNLGDRIQNLESSQSLLTSSPTDNWFFQGSAFDNPLVQEGDLLFTSTTNPVQRASATFVSSRKLSPRLQGTMHSKTFVITNRYLHLRVAGKGSRANVIIENFQVIRAPIYGDIKKSIDNPEFQWVTFDLEMWKGRRAYLELLDQTTPDIGDTLSGNGYPADAWIDFAEVLASDESKPPKREALVESMELEPDAMKVLTKIDAVEVSEPVPIPGLTDSEGVDEHVFIRGGPNNPGDLVERRFLEGLGGMEQPVKAGSGRLEIAEMIASRDNPLTARVWVNRIWHQLYGRGIVPTVDDFGVLGDEPSHPELLDWLANWFVTEGEWSTKELIKLLVSTSAWQQSAIALNSPFDELDPQNVLLHKWTVRRLEGEAIRDNILAVSGRLDLNPPGESVKVHLTDFMTGRGRPGDSGPLDGDGKRSVYLEVRRNFMPPMMLAFDTPQTAQTFGRRSQSNVPAQALILLNDPFVQQQAKLFAEQMLKEVETGSTGDRVSWLYEQVLQREPKEVEQNAAAEFLGEAPSEQNWADLCHVLFNTKEFVFVN